MLDITLTVIEWLGIIAFAVAGAMVGIDKKLDIFGVCICAITTSIGGGILRDVMCASIPLIFKKRVYALACIAGSLSYYLLYLYVNATLAIIVGAGVTVLIRLLATHFKWNMPTAL